MRLVRNLLLGLVLGTVALAVTTPVAEAGKKAAAADADPFEGVPEIKPSTIAEFDSVFNEAGGIQGELKGSYKGVKDARTNLNTALGVATDAPLATALADLKTKGAGKLKVAMNGTMPKLEASEAVPENVQAGLDAINGLVEAGDKTAKSVLAMKDKVSALVTQAQAFPMKVPTMLGSLTPDQAKTAPKIVGDNVKAIKAMPGQIESLGKLVEGTFKDISGAFAG